MDCGQWIVWTGVLWTVDCGLWTMDCGQWTVDSGLCGQWTVRTVDCIQWTVDSGQCVQWKVGYGQWTGGCRHWAVAEGKLALTERRTFRQSVSPSAEKEKLTMPGPVCYRRRSPAFS
jgi:hypothetical protein